MGIVLTDPAFTGTTFVVIDFETLTPAGRPPVPIEVAAIAGRFTEEGGWAESGRFQSLMRPPDDVPFTSFDQAQTDYLTRTERTTVNKSFTASGRLEVTLTRGWEQHPVLSQRDSGRPTLEDQLPALIRVLGIGKAEAEWAQKEEERRADIRKERWEEVKKEVFVRVVYEHNAERLRAELDSRDAVAAMRAYADEIDAHAAALEVSAAQAAREWAESIREHTERTDPLNGALHVAKVTSCRYEELQPHMNGWSAHGPYRH